MKIGLLRASIGGGFHFAGMETIEEIPEPKWIKDDDVGQKAGGEREKKGHQIDEKNPRSQEDAFRQTHGFLQKRNPRKGPRPFRGFV